MTATPNDLAKAKLTARQIAVLAALYWDRMGVQATSAMLCVSERRVRQLRDIGLKKLGKVGINLPALTQTRSHMAGRALTNVNIDNARCTRIA